MAPYYWKDEKGSVSYPYKSHELWFLTKSVRWGFLPEDTLANAKTLIDKVNREDIWREAAKEAGIAAVDIPTSISRGIETFFDGVKFDPENPTAASMPTTSFLGRELIAPVGLNTSGL